VRGEKRTREKRTRNKEKGTRNKRTRNKGEKNKEQGILRTWEQGNILHCELVIPNFQTPISNL
jgi:hypothetical protein